MEVVYPLVIYLVVFGALAKIAARAGFPPWHSVLLLIPFVNLGALVYLALADWPLEDQAFRYRMKDADEELHDPGYLLKRWLKKAIALERAGKIPQAIRLYEKIAADTTTGNAELARTAIGRLRQSSTAIRES